MMEIPEEIRKLEDTFEETQIVTKLSDWIRFESGSIWKDILTHLDCSIDSARQELELRDLQSIAEPSRLQGEIRAYKVLKALVPTIIEDLKSKEAIAKEANDGE